MVETTQQLALRLQGLQQRNQTNTPQYLAARAEYYRQVQAQSIPQERPRVVTRIIGMNDNSATIGYYALDDQTGEYRLTKTVPQEYNNRERSRKNDVVNWVIGFDPENRNDYVSFDERLRGADKPQYVNPEAARAAAERAAERWDKFRTEQQDALKSAYLESQTARYGDRREINRIFQDTFNQKPPESYVESQRYVQSQEQQAKKAAYLATEGQVWSSSAAHMQAVRNVATELFANNPKLEKYESAQFATPSTDDLNRYKSPIELKSMYDYFNQFNNRITEALLKINEQRFLSQTDQAKAILDNKTVGYLPGLPEKYKTSDEYMAIMGSISSAKEAVKAILIDEPDRAELLQKTELYNKTVGHVPELPEKIESKLTEWDTKAEAKYNLKQVSDDLQKSYDLIYKGKLDEEPATKFMLEFGVGTTKAILEQPVTTAGNLVASILVPKIISAVPILSAPAGAGKITKHVNAVNVVGTILTGAYGYSVASRITDSDNKLKTIHSIFGTELLPFAVGGYIGTRRIPQIPYKISVGKPRGVLFEIKDMYSGHEKYIPENKLVVSGTKEVQPESGSVFASESKNGLIDLYLRPKATTAKEWIAQLEGHADYVYTKYGSHLKIEPTGVRTNTESTYKLLEKQERISDTQISDFLNKKTDGEDVDFIKKILTPVFEKQGINVAKIASRDFKIKFESGSFFSDIRNSARYDSGTNTIHLRRGRTGADIVYDIGHEVGHATRKIGALNTKIEKVNLILGEATAFSSEIQFVKNFNKIYNTNLKTKIPLKYPFSEKFSLYSISGYAGSKIPILSKILKPEYKIHNSNIKTVFEILRNIKTGIGTKIRLEKKIDIHPAEIKFIEQAKHLGIPERTWDYEIGDEILKPGKGNMEWKVYGGEVKGAPVRQTTTGRVMGEQKLIHERQIIDLEKILNNHKVAKTINKEPEQFKSIFDEKQNELAEYVKNIYTQDKVRIASVKTSHPLTKTQQKTGLETASSSLTPKLQREQETKQKLKVKVMERVNTNILDITKLFEKFENKDIQKHIRPTITANKSNESRKRIISNILNKTTDSPPPGKYPSPSNYPSPNKYPSPSNYPSPNKYPSPSNYPSPSTHPRPDKPEPPRPPKLKIPPFSYSPQNTSSTGKKKKRKHTKYYKYSIRNNVPTLETLLRSI